MPEYQAIYKCRLCGEEIEEGKTKDISVVKVRVFDACLFSSDFPNPRVANRQKWAIPHMCKNGSIGLAEFLGFRKVE